jgi:hypothetical protein
MYNSVADLETDVIRQIDAHDLDAALLLIVRFVEAVIADSRATANVFGCPTLDTLCQRIGKEALGVISGPFREKAQDNQDLVVFIATVLFKTGGHSAVIEDLIKAQPEKKYLIVLTDLYGSCDITSVRNRFAPLKVPVESTSSGTALSKLEWLLRRLVELGPGRVYLLNDHQDAVAIAASQPALNSQVIFFHHGDHHLCLGVYLPEAVHVDPHNLGYFNCRNQLGLVKNRYWPLVVEDLGSRSPRLPFLEDGTLRTCSSGHKSKFEEPYLYVYSEEVPRLLEVTHGVHIHIGELSPKTLETIYDGMSKRCIGKEGFIYIPWVKSLWMAMIEQRVDLYISSFPLGGGRAAIEVMGSGTPMVMHESYVSRFHGGLDIAYPEVFSWRRPTELYKYFQNLTSDLLVTESANARAHYERYHTPDRLKQELKTFEMGTEGLEPLPLRSHAQDKLQIFLDHTMTDHVALNYQISIRDQQITQMNQLISLKDEQIDQKEHKIAQLEATVQAKQGELNRISASSGWGLFKIFDRVKDKSK